MPLRSTRFVLAALLAAVTACDVPPPATGSCTATDESSRQTVRFHFAMAASGYLVTMGNVCSPYSLTRLATPEQPLLLGLYPTPTCEGIDAGSSYASSVVSLPQAATPVVLTWDARELRTVRCDVECEGRLSSAPEHQTATLGTWHPVAPGRYRATFALFDALPASCTDGGNGYATCRFGAGAFTFEQCRADRTVDVEFDLPASGDLDVLVGVPDAVDAASADASGG